MKNELLWKLIELALNSDAKSESEKSSIESKKEVRPVVAFANNCIIYGYTDATELGQITINQARYAHYYNNCEDSEKNGFMSLAKSGPNKGSQISSPVDGVTVDVICFIEATPEAIKNWESSEWK